MYHLKRLRELRERENLKQRNVAELLKITRQQYGLYEIGKREIPAHYLPILAQFYHTSVDYMLEVTDETEPHEFNKVK